VYITAAAAAIANARRYATARKLADDLARALDSRATIDQARGILMERRGISAERAFAEMAQESQNANVKLRVIAARLVASVQPPPPPDGINT
jgi:AmiR/NasT family two-component response regulator